MSWSAQVEDWDSANRVVHVKFTESATQEVYSNQYPVPLGATPTWLADLVRDEIARLTARAGATIGIVVGAVTPSAVSSAPAANTARDQWLADFLKLKRMNVLITQGVLTSGDINFVTQLAKVKTGYDPTYIDYVNNQT